MKAYNLNTAIEKIKEIARLNAIYSQTLGINIHGEDPTKEISFTDGFMSGAEARLVYRGLDVAQRVIDAPAQDAIRNGFIIKTNYDNEAEIGKLIQERLEVLNIKKVLLQYLINGRIYSRGTIIYPAIYELGNNDLTKPLYLNAIEKIYSFNVIPEDYFSYRVQNVDPLSNDWGKMVEFFVNGRLLHNSRFFYYVQNFDPIRQRGISTLERIRTACTGIVIAEWTITQLLLRYRALIVKYPADEISRVKLGERAGLKQRIVELINSIKMQFTSKSVVGVPSNYEFEYLQTSFDGLKEATDYLYEYLSTVTKVPQNILRGSAKGELASSEKDQRDYYDSVKSEEQIEKIEPLLKWLISFVVYERAGQIRSKCEQLGIPLEDIAPTIEFNPLYSETPSNLAQLKLAKAQYYTTLAQSNLLPRDFLQNEILNDLFPHADKDTVITDFSETDMEIENPFNLSSTTTDPLGLLKDAKENFGGVWNNIIEFEKYFSTIK